MPEMMVPALDLAGAVAFVLGSIFFVLSSVMVDSWLHLYLIGCALWIPGCCFYLAMVVLSAVHAHTKAAVMSGERVAAFLLAACMCAFIVGCIVPLCARSEDAVVASAGVINASFLCGSVCALLAALIELCRTCRKGGAQMAAILNVISTSCYVIAAVVGGYYALSHLVAGMTFWLVGALFAMPAPLAALAMLRVKDLKPSDEFEQVCATSTVPTPALHRHDKSDDRPTSPSSSVGGAIPQERIDAARVAWESLFESRSSSPTSSASASQSSPLSSSMSAKLSLQESDRLKLARSTDELDLTYGDSTFDAILPGLCAAGLPDGGVFVDLGSGSGRAVFAAALLCNLSRCVGVEILGALHEQAAEPLRRFNELRQRLTAEAASRPAGAPAREPCCLARCVELKHADLFDVALDGADVVFCCCVTWEWPILHRLAEKLAAELAHGARVLTVGRPLRAHVDLPPASLEDGEKGRGGAHGHTRHVEFVETWHGVAHLAWGKEALFLHRVDRMSREIG